MSKHTYENIVVVTRKTQLEELVARFNTISQARFYLESANQSFEPLQQAHDIQHQTLDAVRDAVPSGTKNQIIDRDLVPQFTFGADDLVIVVGQDGVVSNTAKYLEEQPVLGVNPDPNRFDGVLLPFNAKTIGAGVGRCMNGKDQVANVSLAEARLEDGQSLLAFNDFFIGAQSHVSARYRINLAGCSENQSSSGIIVSTGAGSTGWLQSVYSGAQGVIEALGGQVVPPPDGGRLPWDTNKLLYSVREPFPSVATETSMVHGAFGNQDRLVVTSHMSTNGVIFSDGVESDFLSFNSGAQVTIGVAKKVARLVLAHQK